MLGVITKGAWFQGPWYQSSVVIDVLGLIALTVVIIMLIRRLRSTKLLESNFSNAEELSLDWFITFIRILSVLQLTFC